MGYNGFIESSRSLGSLGAMVTNLQFNNREQLTQFNMLDWNYADNSPYYVQWQWFYEYGAANNNGNLLKVKELNSPSTISTPSSSLSPAVITTFTYDSENRLASVADNSYSRSMCYDAYGNGWITAYSGTPSVSGNAPVQNGGTCPAGSGPTPYITGTNKLISASYDNNGNQTNFRGNTVNYDAENRVVSVVNGAATLVSYQYDGDGRRVQKTTPAATTNYAYDASGALMAEYIGATLSKEYVRFHSSFIGSNVDLVAIENAAGNGAPCATCFVIPDYLGNVRMMADNAGHAVSRRDYLPFGEEASADPNRPAAAGFGLGDGTTQRYTGKERDSDLESGLDYFGARYYGSALGRFTSADQPLVDQHPEDPQSWNLYVYGRNNPLSYVDPTGNCSVKSGNSAATDDPDSPCVKPGDTSVTVTAKAPDPDEERVGQLVRFTSAALDTQLRETRDIAVTVYASELLGVGLGKLAGGAVALARISRANGAIDSLLFRSLGGVESDFAIQYTVRGTADDAAAEFDAIAANAESVSTRSPTVKVAELGDGTKVNIHSSGTSGARTIEVQRPSLDKLLKFRFEK